MSSMELSKWYAIRVKSNREWVTAQALQGKEFAVFLPVYHDLRYRNGQRREVQVPLFAGYVFSRFDSNHRLAILTTPGVVHIVGIGNVPEPVDPDEMAAVVEITKSGLPISPHPYLTAGQKVRLERGPLRGTTGTILEQGDGGRLVVSVSLLQRSIAVAVERDWVTTLAPLRFETNT
jgi:transcription antitermination factor NusG